MVAAPRTDGSLKDEVAAHQDAAALFVQTHMACGITTTDAGALKVDEDAAALLAQAWGKHYQWHVWYTASCLRAGTRGPMPHAPIILG